MKLGAFFINTGDMYRALTWAALQRGIDVKEEKAKVVELLEEIDIRYVTNYRKKLTLTSQGQALEPSQLRTPDVTEKVSYVAAIPAVREWLVARQRESADLGLLVMEGRDIGTAVFPQARYKFFVTASPEVRAMRRLAQDGEVPKGTTVKSVAADISKRDQLDMTRAVSPLRQAEDAIYIDTSNLSVDEAAEKIVKYVRKKQSIIHA